MVVQVQPHQVREFFLQIEQGAQLQDLLLHLRQLAGVSLSVGLLLLALGNLLLRLVLAESALGLLMAKAGEAGGIESFPPKQGAEFAGFVTGVGKFENAEFIRDRKASSGRLLDHLGIGSRALALGKSGGRSRLSVGVAVGVSVFENECVHGKEPSPP